ncbi:hypothetical protein UFOVP1201_4 [uncultured Caudovirales phage]|uniref:Uncharacterized protein n=1 Tax=uncultured Caudovirales phage TaxID=2100421 RepID=A0A6J5NWR3_9CAUD|nr:hypothetical protein UFOVP788_24 [uncultured Caudovirales phage]CAB4189516.1 hypothetical protein UFOVP1201_4 [uncultured Caudovirales phage]
MIITIDGIREIVGDVDTIFMKQGKSGKAVHISSGKSRSNVLLCGATRSRNGSRQSYLFPLFITKIETDLMCKDCVAILHERIQPLVTVGA